MVVMPMFHSYITKMDIPSDAVGLKRLNVPLFYCQMVDVVRIQSDLSSTDNSGIGGYAFSSVCATGPFLALKNSNVTARLTLTFGPGFLSGKNFPSDCLQLEIDFLVQAHWDHVFSYPFYFLFPGVWNQRVSEGSSAIGS